MKTKPSASATAVSPARAAAFDILLRVERESSYASELLHSPTHSALTTQDQALVTEIVLGTLRWRALLDEKISASSSQPLPRLDLEVLTALRLAVYQILFLSRVPARAAINESVQLVKRARKRSAAPFVNAVLRKIAGGKIAAGKIGPDKIASDVSTAAESATGEIAADSADALASASSHPLWLVERWVQQYGMEAARNICLHNQSVPVTAIRLRHADAEAQLRAEGIELAPAALLATARRVRHGDVTKTAAFRTGLCAIQDEASQLIATLVGQGSRILDCCAAPGGKTLALADRNPRSSIVAAELHPHRARLLQRFMHPHTTTDPGNSNGNIHVMVADACRLPFACHFDRILVDVPCSGTGTLGRNPEIKWRLRKEDLADLQSRQLAILRAVAAQVAIGGRLVYSSCSLEREENEEVIEIFLGEHSRFRLIDCGAELNGLREKGGFIGPDLPPLTRGNYLRTIPGLHACDGFFAAILERI